jgi:hypothetical protein
MEPGVVAISGAVFMLLLFVVVGGPMLLVNWSRRRRQQEIARQIALTDALDGRLGSVVAPLVRKPLFHPWEIRIAVPLHQSATVARILSIVDEVFHEGPSAPVYRIFLAARPEAVRETRPPRRKNRWIGGPIPAA